MNAVTATMWVLFKLATATATSAQIPTRPNSRIFLPQIISKLITPAMQIMMIAQLTSEIPNPPQPIFVRYAEILAIDATVTHPE